MTERRRSPLPRNWPQLRQHVLGRDGHVCTLGYDGCLVLATEVDHVGDRDDHSPDNLRSACSRCHATRTGRQGAAKTRRRREPEPHPGLTGKSNAAELVHELAKESSEDAR
jgi:5-methylcytosine-specific restriction endonuclease McrA